MWNAEILKGGESADRRRYQIIGDEQKRTDDRDDLAAMTHARVNAAAVGVEAADNHVIDADECGQHTHQRDEPEGGVTCDGEGKTDDVGLARAPIAVEDNRIKQAVSRNIGEDKSRAKRLEQGGRREAPRYRL